MSSSTAIFACADLEATLNHYVDVLGFRVDWKWGEPPSIGSASRGNVTIMFSHQPELAARVRGHEHWINADDIDEVYELHVSRGANIVSEISDRPYGFREYVVEDPNGYRLRFARPNGDDAQPSTPLPEGVTFERRKPTADEFALVAGSTFEYKRATSKLLDDTWGGVIARSPEGEAIGALRIMWDAPGWFSIWDVAVLPDWQARRVGSTMMKEALESVREVSPGANVFLFTIKPGFYERLGFGECGASMIRV